MNDDRDMRCALEVAPIDLGEQLPAVGVLNAERGMCRQRRNELYDELQHVEHRLEDTEHRLDNIYAPSASREAAATDTVVREEDRRTVAASVPRMDSLHLAWAVNTREITRRMASYDCLRAWVTEELEQFLYYSEQHHTEHRGRHDEVCHLPRPFNLIQEHYTSRLQIIDRNSGRAHAELQVLNRDLVRDEAHRARVAQVAAAAATMAMVAAAAAFECCEGVANLRPANGTADPAAPAPPPAVTLAGGDDEDGAGGAARERSESATEPATAAVTEPPTASSSNEGSSHQVHEGSPRYLKRATSSPCPVERLRRDGLLLSARAWKLLLLWVLTGAAVGATPRPMIHPSGSPSAKRVMALLVTAPGVAASGPLQRQSIGLVGPLTKAAIGGPSTSQWAAAIAVLIVIATVAAQCYSANGRSNVEDAPHADPTTPERQEQAIDTAAWMSASQHPGRVVDNTSTADVNTEAGPDSPGEAFWERVGLRGSKEASESAGSADE
jgi:hypothetical protein